MENVDTPRTFSAHTDRHTHTHTHAQTHTHTLAATHSDDGLTRMSGSLCVRVWARVRVHVNHLSVWTTRKNGMSTRCSSGGRAGGAVGAAPWRVMARGLAATAAASPAPHSLRRRRVRRAAGGHAGSCPGAEGPAAEQQHCHVARSQQEQNSGGERNGRKILVVGAFSIKWKWVLNRTVSLGTVYVI